MQYGYFGWVTTSYPKPEPEPEIYKVRRFYRTESDAIRYVRLHLRFRLMHETIQPGDIITVEIHEAQLPVVSVAEHVVTMQ